MPQVIKFKSGEKLPFIATRSFTMGTPPISFRKGQDVLFDGSQAEIDGEVYTIPNLRGACKPEVGWLVLADSYDEDAPEVRVSANMQVRHPTKGGNPLAPPEKSVVVTVEDDERIVGTHSAVTAATQATNANYRNRSAVKVKDQHGMRVEIEEQDGVPVRTLQTKAKNHTVFEGNNVSDSMSAVSKVVITPSKGITAEEYMAKMSPEEREEYLAKKEEKRSAYADVAPKETRKIVGRVKNAGSKTQDGITTTVTTGGGTEMYDPSTGATQNVTQVIEQDGIKFTTTNGPKQKDSTPVVRPAASVNARRSIAKSMCADFPDSYDFGAPAKKRIARLLADFEDRPDVIRAAFAAETDDVQAALEQEFPQAFES